MKPVYLLSVLLACCALAAPGADKWLALFRPDTYTGTSASMKAKTTFGCLLAALILPLNAQTPAETDEFVKMLSDADMDVRIEGLRGLQTSLDPRIPAASLKLLSDEGNSIRRLAARAVGSRYFQIPDADKPKYLKALQPLLKSEFADEANMARRAIGLLTWKFDSGVFSVSPTKRWVIYERYMLPCLIDTTNRTEELLGWKQDNYDAFAPVWGDCEMGNSAAWTKSGSAVALDIIFTRKRNTVWVWEEAGSRLTKFEEFDMVKATSVDPAQMHDAGGLFCDIKGWDGNELKLELSFTTAKGNDQFTDHIAELGWSLETRKFRKISLKSEPG